MGFAIPIPTSFLNELVVLLRQGSADMVSVLFALTGTPVYRNDFVFSLPGLAIEVAEACSGIRSTIAMFIVSVLAANLLLKSAWKRTAFLFLVIPVSLFKNAVRIVTLTLLALHYDRRFLDGSLHHDGGIVFMLGGLCLMYPILAILVRSERTTELDHGAQA
jgi:exosortase